MDQIYLLRHGIAVPHGAPDVPEDQRPLTPEGEKRIRQVGRGLARLDLKLDRIVSSPLPRALKTAEIVAEALGMEALLESNDALLAGRDAASIRDWVQTRPELRIMLVGHNPAFSDLVGLLITGGPGRPVCELRKGGIAAFSTAPDGKFELDWLARPRLFRHLVDS
jgi:phosphohistidine phosphatase